MIRDNFRLPEFNSSGRIWRVETKNGLSKVTLTPKPKSQDLNIHPEEQLLDGISKIFGFEDLGKLGITGGYPVVILKQLLEGKSLLEGWKHKRIRPNELYVNPDQKVQVVAIDQEVIASSGQILVSPAHGYCQAILAETRQQLVFKHNVNTLNHKPYNGVEFLQRVKAEYKAIDDVTLVGVEIESLNYLAKGALDLGIDPDRIHIGLAKGFSISYGFRFWALNSNRAEGLSNNTVVKITTEDPNHDRPKVLIPLTLKNYTSTKT